MLLLAAVCALYSCSSDDDNDNKIENTAILGTWYAEEYYGEGTDLTFYSNGRVTEESYPLRGNSWRYRYTGTFKTEGNKLTIHWKKGENWQISTNSWVTDDNEEETVVITFGILENELIFYAMEGEDNYNITIHTRK